jgi:hypothetical protein
MTGGTAPGTELADVAFELEALGVSDLSVAGARVPGAFRPPEQIVSQILFPRRVDPRIVEAMPAVLAWNCWEVGLLTSYGRFQSYGTSAFPRMVRRTAWLADVVLTIDRGGAFPGGVKDPIVLEEFIAGAPAVAEPDDLGFPGDPAKLPPVSKRWGITYAADLETFRDRAVQLIEHDRLGRFPERPDGRR